MYANSKALLLLSYTQSQQTANALLFQWILRVSKCAEHFNHNSLCSQATLTQTQRLLCLHYNSLMPFCLVFLNTKAAVSEAYLQKTHDEGVETLLIIGFNIWCSVLNFIKIGRFLTEIWRFNDFQNGGRPPSLILKICSSCHVALVDIPFCFHIQNFAEIGQSVDDLWPKKRFSRWRTPPSWILNISIFGHVTATGFNIWCSVSNFIKIGRFLTEIWRFNDFQYGGRPPSLILIICSFCHVALVDIPFCFHIQNFAEIGQSVDDLRQKKRFSRWRPHNQFLVTWL